MKHLKVLFCMILALFLVMSSCTSQSSRRDRDIEKFNVISEKEMNRTKAAKDPSGDESGIEDAKDNEKDKSLYLQSQQLQQKKLCLYFYDEKAKQLSPEVRSISDWNENELPRSVIRELIRGPRTSRLRPVLPQNVKINNVDDTEDILSVDLSSEFLESTDPIVARAALVNSLLDLGMFKYVKLYVDGKETTTQNGDNDVVLLGLLTQYPNSVPEMKAYEAQNAGGKDIHKTNLELFFQDDRGMYLLPEARAIMVAGKKYAEAIVSELIKGPMATDQGYCPTLPKGTNLQETKVVQREDGAQGIALYFSKEFRTQFTGGQTQEIAMLSSLVYSLTSLPDISFVKIYYENEAGSYIDEPVYGISLKEGLTKKNFPNRTGRRVRIYYGDPDNMLLVPEYRAVSKSGSDIAVKILSELISDPIHSGNVRVIPDDVRQEDIKVKVEKGLAIVNIPSSCLDKETGRDSDKETIRDLYAIVNSLTDPLNRSDIMQVQFTVDGKAIKKYKDISLKDTFSMNPALIKEEKTQSR